MRNQLSFFIKRVLYPLFILVIIICGNNAYGKTEQALKAAYVYYFSRYISWNPKQENNNNTINICLLKGSDAMLAQFRSLKSKSTGKQTLTVSRVEPEKHRHITQHCHILYIENKMSNINISAFSHTPGLLIITDQEADSRGTINFVVHNNQLSFEINFIQAQKLQLTISSRLLRLAAKVKY